MASGQGIGEFFVSLSVDAVSGELTVSNLISSFGELEIATVAEIGALWALGVGLARITDQAIQLSLGFEQFTMHTGLSAQQLQKWQIVAAQSHASAQDVTGSVEALTKHLANLTVGIPDAALGALQQLGVSPFDSITGKSKDAFQVLDEVRERLRYIKDAGQQERILSGLGINPNLRETLLLANDVFAKRANLVPGMSSEQEATFDHLRQTMIELELKSKQIGLNIAAWISPGVEKFFRFLEAMLKPLEPGYANSPEAKAQKAGEEQIFNALRNSSLGKFLLDHDERTGPEQLRSLLDRITGPTPAAAAAVSESRGGSGPVTIDKHDTYIIHDAHNPDKVRETIEKSWDDILGRKTLDGFDRQQNNGGF